MSYFLACSKFFFVAGKSCVENVVHLPDCLPFDYMHQVLLGVVRTILHNMSKGLMSNRTREIVNKRLLSFRLPYQDFSRQFRSLQTLKYWKASEFKSFLLYGFMTLTGCVHYEVFVHFVLLSFAVRILLEEHDDPSMVQRAKVLLHTFRQRLPEIYGESSQTFNMHALSHLADDVSFI